VIHWVSSFEQIGINVIQKLLLTHEITLDMGLNGSNHEQVEIGPQVEITVE
jgi:hypothetical protein